MKVSMDDSGYLVIDVDNIVESYALQHWYDRWRQQSSSLVIRHGNEKHVYVNNVEPQHKVDVDYSKTDFRDIPGEDFYNK